MPPKSIFNFFDFLDEERRRGGWRAGLANMVIGFVGVLIVLGAIIFTEILRAIFLFFGIMTLIAWATLSGHFGPVNPATVQTFLPIYAIGAAGYLYLYLFPEGRPGLREFFSLAYWDRRLFDIEISRLEHKGSFTVFALLVLLGSLGLFFAR